MPLVAIPAFVAFLLNLSIGLSLIFSRPRSIQNLWLGIFILSFSVWNLSQVLIVSYFTKPVILAIAKILYRTLFLTPAFFVVVSYYYPIELELGREPKIFFLLKVFLFPIILLYLSLPYVDIEIYHLGSIPDNYFFKVKVHSLPYLFLLFSVFLGYTAWGAKLMYDKIKTIKLARLRTKSKIFLIGNVTIFFLIAILSLLKYSVLSRGTLWYLAITTLTLLISIFFLFMSLEHRWLSVRKIISGSITYTLFTAVIITINFLLLQYISGKLSDIFEINSFITNSLLLFAVILLFTPFINFFRKRIDDIVFKNENIFNKKLQDFITKATISLDVDILFKETEEFLKRILNVEYIVIMINNEKDGYETVNNIYEDFFIPYDCYLEKILLKYAGVVEVYELDRDRIDDKIILGLDFMEAWLLMPLIMNNSLLGIVIIPKPHGLKVSAGIIESLNYFAGELALILQRNFLIEKMKNEAKEKQKLERLAAMGKLTSGIAHEIRNPLNTISVSAQTLMRKINDEQSREILGFIIDEAERLSKILTDFLSLTHIRGIEISLVDIQEISDKLELFVRNRNPQILFSVITHFKPEEIKTDGDLLYQALLNIVGNALDAIDQRCNNEEGFVCSNGKILIDFYKRRNKIFIDVKNNGMPVSKEVIEKIFDPFFTTKETGTGLGLTITYNIIQSLGGEISAKSNNNFTIFEIVLPEK